MTQGRSRAAVGSGEKECHAQVMTLCLVAWGMRLGILADLLSRPVLVGSMAGAANLGAGVLRQSTNSAALVMSRSVFGRRAIRVALSPCAG
ncbi:hypothetical protein OG311_34010 [Streptomyces sp. NBC_01343]|uniref:hypothetical protein n=1 Tax=Streptomyces sp. NBC_01343 TaxID=2903832 RepID=UPI002E16751E|nr:hypothetical protein OG311_34010 [Streptomyces sp. NBC_01343]